MPIVLGKFHTTFLSKTVAEVQKLMILPHQPNETRLVNKQLSSKENLSSYTASCLSFTHFQNISQKISRIKFVCITPEVYVQRG